MKKSQKSGTKARLEMLERKTEEIDQVVVQLLTLLNLNVQWDRLEFGIKRNKIKAQKGLSLIRRKRLAGQAKVSCTNGVIRRAQQVK